MSVFGKIILYISNIFPKNGVYMWKNLEKNSTICYDKHKEKYFLGKGGPDMSYSVIDVAEYTLWYCMDKQRPISNLQLQKFLYYIQGYSLQRFNGPAFKDEIRHWKYGPVIPEAYYRYCQYVRQPIRVSLETPCDNSVSENSKLSKLIQKVCDKCLELRPSELVNQTHNEDPWKDSEDSGLISIEKLLKYFQKNDPLGIG